MQLTCIKWTSLEWTSLPSIVCSGHKFQHITHSAKTLPTPYCGTLDWSKVYSFAHRQRESCTRSVSVCSSHYIHSAAPSHQLWRAFTWVDRWLSWGSTAPNRGALTCQLSVRPQNQLCHVISSMPITVTHQVCVRKQCWRLQFNTTLPWANG